MSAKDIVVRNNVITHLIFFCNNPGPIKPNAMKDNLLDLGRQGRIMLDMKHGC